MEYNSFLAGLSWRPEMMTMKLLIPVPAPGRHLMVETVTINTSCYYALYLQPVFTEWPVGSHQCARPWEVQKCWRGISQEEIFSGSSGIGLVYFYSQTKKGNSLSYIVFSIANLYPLREQLIIFLHYAGILIIFWEDKIKRRKNLPTILHPKTSNCFLFGPRSGWVKFH